MKPASSASPTAAGPTDTRHTDSAGAGPDRVDAINQVFAEFSLAYHNQYRKAYPDEASVMLAKKYWLACLAEFSPQQIVRAGRAAVKSSEFLPTVAAVVKACESGHTLFGLPSPREAYLEACRATSPKSAWPWSHPAVYHAGVASDWYLLASEPESVAMPVFAHHYAVFSRRVMQGDALTTPSPPALPAEVRRPLTAAERQARMRALRASLDI